MADGSVFKAALTGSIAMGKSTVAVMLRDAGVAVFDADAVVHRLYAKNGGAVEPVGRLFPSVVRNGAIDRVALSKQVLNNTQAMKQLEAIVHPLVRREQDAFLETVKSSEKSIAVFDIPLLFETGRAAEFDAVLVVSAPYEVQRARALARPDMSEEKFEAILARQVPDEEKRAAASHIISTDVPMDDTRARVLAIVSELQSLAGER
ncbi:dephospho-CoA kinase [Anderseniella sp. Alg231-50]|uniref:dephospho-CoA kinase n=1 Tax=Anderseniella sp. Alg231-50 TaxID=1922226 RepID=UPI000D55CED3